MTARPRLVATAALLALALAGCGGEPDPAVETPTAPAATPTDPVPTAGDEATTGPTDDPTDDPTGGPTGAPTTPPPFPPTEGASEGSGGAADGTCLEGATECADDPSTDGPPAPAEGTPVDEQADLVEVEATPWESVAPVDDEQVVLEVQWFGGNEACFGLDRVEVVETDEAVSITVFTGRVDGSEVCTTEAVLKSTEVELSEPLGPRSILDGAEG